MEESNMKNLNLFFLMIAVIAMVACSEKTDTANMNEQENELTEKFNKATNTGDADALAELHADEAIRMNQNEPAWVGKEAIRNGFRQLFEKNILNGTNKVVEVINTGDYHIVRGTYSGTIMSKMGSSIEKSESKWISVNKLQPDGSRKIILTIWNSDLPAVTTTE